jgi:PilZ domain
MSDDQSAQDQKRMAEGHKADRRRYQRFEVPAVYQRYIKLRVKAGNDFIPASLSNFSRRGILFECAAPFDIDKHTECIISASLLLSQDISFGIAVKYCKKKEQVFRIGATIETVADATWFNVFAEIHDFIVQRQDSVY